MCDVVRRFLDSIVELKGNEYVKRAITYISTFIPEGKRNEMELLDFLSSSSQKTSSDIVGRG